MKLPRFLDTYSGLPRSIYVLFFARVINSMGSFVYPFLTLFLTDKMGLKEQEAGIFFMIAAFVGILGSFIGGFLTDRFGRKKIVVIFQGLGAMSIASSAFVGLTMVVPILLIITNFFGSIVGPAYSSMIADLTNEENRKRSYSLLYLGINIGFSIGPLIAGFLYNNYITLMFLGDALTTFLSIILILIFVSETKPTEEKLKASLEMASDERAETGSLLSVLLRRPALLAFTLIFAIFNFVYAQHSYSIPLQLKELFGAKDGSQMFGTIMATNGIVVILFTTLLTKATRKLKPIQNMIIAGILFGLGFGLIYFTDRYLFIWALTILWTLGEILESTNAGVYIANHTPMSHRGRFNSVLPIITGLGYSMSPFITGGFIESVGVRMVWPLAFILAIISASLMYILYLSEKKKYTNLPMAIHNES